MAVSVVLSLNFVENCAVPFHVCRKLLDLLSSVAIRSAVIEGFSILRPTLKLLFFFCSDFLTIPQSMALIHYKCATLA